MKTTVVPISRPPLREIQVVVKDNGYGFLRVVGKDGKDLVAINIDRKAREALHKALEFPED